MGVELNPKDKRYDIALSYVATSAFLFFVIIYFDLPETNILRDETNPWIAIFGVLGLGAAIHTLYRNVIGELILFPIQMRIHQYWDNALRAAAEKANSSREYLKSLGVKPRDLREAYTESRRILRENNSGTEDVLRGSIHFTYNISLIMVFFGIVLLLKDKPYLFCLIVGFLVLLCAFYIDSRQHRHEVRRFRQFNGEGKLKAGLVELGLIDSDQTLKA